MVWSHREGRFKAETGGNRPLQDVSSEQLELRAGSGLAAANPIDVGVCDTASTGLGLEKAPENAGNVPVRYALVGAGQDPRIRSPGCTPPSRTVYCRDTDMNAASPLDASSLLAYPLAGRV